MVDETREDLEAIADIERETLQSKNWRLPPEAYARMLKIARQDPGFAEDLSTRARVLHAARRVIARHDSSAFAEFVLRTEAEGKKIRQAPFHDTMHQVIRDRDRVVIWGSPTTGKCCATGTPVQLADGSQKPIESITTPVRVAVFDPASGQHKDLEAGPVFDNGIRDCVEVTLSRGTQFTVTCNHRLYTVRGWVEADDVRPGEFVACVRKVHVSPTDSVSAEEAELLGFMTADGGCTTHTPTWTKSEAAQIDRMSVLCAQQGWALRIKPGCTGQYTLTTASDGHRQSAKHAASAAAWCRRWGVDKLSKHKRVPKRLWQATDESLAAFIGALFSGDGYFQTSRNVIELTQASQGLVEDVRTLLLRFGILSRVKYKRAKCAGLFFDSWRLTVTGRESLLAFARAIGARMTGRKRGQLLEMAVWAEASRRGEDGPPLPHPDMTWDMVRDIKWVGAVQTWGLPVHDDSHCFLSDGVIHHNSLQLAVAWPLWILGRAPNRHVCIIQATDANAMKTIRATSAYVADPMSPGFGPLHEVFPRLVPSKSVSAVWNAHAFTVERSATARDPSYQACGLFGNILGARLDVIILDDVLTFANTRNPDQRKRVVDWILTTVINRLDPDTGRMVFMGNAWHPDDAMHAFSDGRLEEQIEATKIVAGGGHWASVRLPLRDEHGKTTWPDKWPQPLLEKRASQLPPGEAARTFDCVASNDATSRFKRAWFALAKKPGLAGELEAGKPALMRAIRKDDDARAYYVGVDLAFADIDRRGDRCAVGVIAVDAGGRVELVSIRSGRWTMDELLGEINSANNLWEPRYIFIESNAAQRVIGRMLKGELALLGLDFPADLKRRIVNYETGVTKHHPKWGIEGIGVEMASGVWSVPCGLAGEVHPEIERWFQDLLHYSPDPKIHTGDRAMAVYIAWDGMRRRLGDRQFHMMDVDPPAPNPMDVIAPRNPPKPNEAKVDHAARLVAERQKKSKALADGLAKLAGTQPVRSVWDDLDDFVS